MPAQLSAATPVEFEDTRAIFRHNLRCRRLALGMTQTELAEAANTKQGYIGDLENGRKTPQMVTLERIATALKTTPAKLLTPPRKKS